MNTYTTQLKIHAIGPLQQSLTTKTTNRWHILTVSEQPKNPFGHTLTEKPQFEVYVYNHNIDHFNISDTLINEVGYFDLDIQFKRNAVGPATPLFVVTDLTFKI
jgi:hypothetical protein